jgi:hypothetical protein
VATESIGILIPTAIPGYTDSADIQAALRAYHYGSYAYDPANTSAASLVSPSIAKTIYDITTDITALENRPSSGGEVNTVQPAATSFTPPEIPDGFIWVDEDGTIGGLPISATAIFTNSAPTTSLTTGVIWVDKDAESITANPFIPQAVINAKGDLLVGTANDTASVLSVGTTGFFLKANSGTTSGLEWAASTADIDGVTAGTGISGGGTSGTVTLSIDTAVTADLTTAQTLTNKTLTTPTISTPSITGAVTAPAVANSGDGYGYIGTPQASKADNYTLVLADAGKDIFVTVTAKTITIPANSSVDFQIGTGFTVTNESAVTTTIAITTDTLILANSASTGSRTLAPYGVAVFKKITATKWIGSGNGLT